MKRTTRHIIIKFLEKTDKEKILKASRGKKCYIQGDKNKDDNRFIITNDASKKSVEQYL